MLSSAASYAVEHFLLSGLLLMVCACVVRWIPAHARHPWLLGALVVAVVGPALPFDFMVPEGPAAGLVAAATPAVGAGAAAGLSVNATWVAALVALWAAVGVVRLYRLAASGRSASALVRRSQRALQIERDHADLLPPGTRVHLSPSFGPAVLGVVAPCIVLPARLAAQLPRESLRAVLAHECEHITRRDPAWYALQRVVLALLWWNPAMKHLGSWLDQSRELACDAGAARRAGNSVQYAEALLCVAVQPLADQAPRWRAGLAMASGSPLLELRIDALLEPERPPQGKRSALVGLLALAMLSAWAAASTATPEVRLSAPAGEWHPWAAANAPALASARQGEPAAVQAGYERLSQTAQSEYERLAETAESEYERLSHTAQSEYERLSQTAQSEHERLSQTAQAEYERLDQLAQSEYERLSQAAQSDYEQRSQSDQGNYERAMAAAQHELNPAQEQSR